MKKVINNKLGVSAVVATVLIIMITVAAVGIIWAAIIPMVRDGLGSSSCNDADISIVSSGGYTCYDSANQKVAVQVKKGSNEVNVTGVGLLFSSAGNSYSANVSYAFANNEYHTFYIPATTLGSVDGVSIVPIVSTGKSCGKVSFTGSLPNCNLGNVKLLGTNYYSVSYDKNGGTGTLPVDSANYKSGETVTILSGSGLAKSGVVFAGWNTQADGNGDNYWAGNRLTIGPENVTLYAQWVIDDKIIYAAKTISSSGTYFLNQSFAGNLIIAIDGVTINGNGFTVTGNVNASRSEFYEGVGYAGYNFSLVNVIVEGVVVSDGASSSTYGGSGGAINITSSNITGLITSIGGFGTMGGSGGAITLLNSITGVVSSNGGNASINQAGAGGKIIISDSTTKVVSSNGGFCDSMVGGDGGNITIRGALTKTDAIYANGASSSYGGGDGGNITIISPCPNLANLGAFSCTRGTPSGVPGICPHTCS